MSELMALDFDIYLLDKNACRTYLGRTTYTVDAEQISSRPQWFTNQPYISVPLRLHPAIGASPLITIGDGAISVDCTMRPITGMVKQTFNLDKDPIACTCTANLPFRNAKHMVNVNSRIEWHNPWEPIDQENPKE